MRLLLLLLLTCVTFSPAFAEKPLALSKAISSQSDTPLEQVGTGKYKKLGMNIYRATLWAPDGEYDKDKPHALQVKYLRTLSKETIVDAVISDVRAQKMADGATMDEWEDMLTDILPGVKNGDEIVGLSTPGQPSKLFFNGKQIASISDERLSDSFFNIWLGPVAPAGLRAQLLAEAK